MKVVDETLHSTAVNQAFGTQRQPCGIDDAKNPSADVSSRSTRMKVPVTHLQQWLCVASVCPLVSLELEP